MCWVFERDFSNLALLILYCLLVITVFAPLPIFKCFFYLLNCGTWFHSTVTLLIPTWLEMLQSLTAYSSLALTYFSHFRLTSIVQHSAHRFLSAIASLGPSSRWSCLSLTVFRLQSTIQLHTCVPLIFRMLAESDDICKVL